MTVDDRPSSPNARDFSRADVAAPVGAHSRTRKEFAMHRCDLARVLIFAAAAVAVLAATGTSTALGQTYDFTFALGYSHVDLDNSDARFHSKDGGYFDMDFAFHLDTDVPLNVGFGITGSGYFDSDDVTFRLSSTTTATTTIYSDVGLFAFEPRVSIPIYANPGSRTGLFVRPRL